MKHWSLLEGGADSTMQSVLEIQVTFPLNDMGKQVTEERRVLSQQRLKVECAFGCFQLSQAYLSRRQVGPFGDCKTVVRVRTLVTNRLENHTSSILTWTLTCDSFRPMVALVSEIYVLQTLATPSPARHLR